MVILAMTCLLQVLLLSGCGKNEERIAELIKMQAGDAQNAMAGSECKDGVIVLVQGPMRGSKRLPAVGVNVKITPMESGAQVEPSEGVTDAGGNFHCRLKLAKKFGDQYFKVECPDFPEVKPYYLYAVAGVTVSGSMQETTAGDDLLEPVQLTITDENGIPTPNVPVFFTLKSGNSAAKISNARTVTDAQGHVSVNLKTAEGYTGKYEIMAEVGEGERRTRGIVIKAMAISNTSLIIGILGGLGIFIYGMALMSDGLQQIAGDRLKTLLQLFTSNRVKAMLAGLIVTSLIQSSGACTVMVVGFVNASLLNLNQAIGIILGSSIGTTVTAQMVSFKLDALALPTIAIGVLLLLLAKKSQVKGMANTILGFGLLFYGMMFMSSQMRAIAEFPTFISFFSKFDCTPAAGSVAPPLMNCIGAIVVGIVMTVIVQSSSATVGLAIALADSGLLNYYTAIPLILGDNIGSTITGLFASLNANRSSLQAAWAGTVHKILGVLIMIPFFYLPWDGQAFFMKLVDVITSGDVFAQVPENIGRHLASAHTLFNILNVFIFLPFTGFIIWLTKLMVPDKASSDKDRNSICHLEQRLLNTPSAALSQVMSALITMTDASGKLTRRAINSIVDTENAATEEEINRTEATIDNAQHAIIDYLVMLTRRNLNVSQSNSIPIFMHCVNDIERIGDRAVNIYQLLPTMQDKEIAFSKTAIDEIREIDTELDKMVKMLLEGLKNNDLDLVQKVIIKDTEIRRMTARFEKSHETRLKSQDCTVEKGVVFVELLSNLERISAHITNVAERAKDIMAHSVVLGARV